MAAKSEQAIKKRNDYIAKYNQEHRKSYTLRLSDLTDKDMMEWIQSKGSTSNYLKELVRKDMES